MMFILSHEVLIVRLAIAIASSYAHYMYMPLVIYIDTLQPKLLTHLASYMHKSYTHSYIVTLYAHNFQL